MIGGYTFLIAPRAARRRGLYAHLGTIVLLTTAGCGDATAPLVASVLSPISATLQDGMVATGVLEPPTVKVLSSGAEPVPGVAVTFIVESGSGMIGANSAVTDENGVASSDYWILGETAGVQTMVATVPGLTDVTFTATAAPGPAASLSSASGGQTAPAGASLPNSPRATVTDIFGNPVPGVTVTFEVASGGGTVAGADATTNSQGVATSGGWTLGPTPGVQTLRIRMGTVAITISATAT